MKVILPLKLRSLGCTMVILRSEYMSTPQLCVHPLRRTDRGIDQSPIDSHLLAPLFLDAPLHLYEIVSVRPSVRWSVRWSLVILEGEKYAY